MGFRENLKAELAHKNLLVKELARAAGINKRTIDNYLRENGSMPSADAAVAIARTLGVTVEYLVTGIGQREAAFSAPLPESGTILKNLEALTKRDRKIVMNLIALLKDMEDSRFPG